MLVVVTGRRRVLPATEGTNDDALAAEHFDRVITLEMLFAHWRIP